MDALNRLINQEVFVNIEVEENEYVKIKCKILSVIVNDFYFYEKNEPIYITATALPLEDLPEDIELEQFNDIPLENITKAY